MRVEPPFPLPGGQCLYLDCFFVCLPFSFFLKFIHSCWFFFLLKTVIRTPIINICCMYVDSILLVCVFSGCLVYCLLLVCFNLFFLWFWLKYWLCIHFTLCPLHSKLYSLQTLLVLLMFLFPEFCLYLQGAKRTLNRGLLSKHCHTAHTQIHCTALHSIELHRT